MWLFYTKSKLHTSSVAAAAAAINIFKKEIRKFVQSEKVMIKSRIK